MNSYLELHDSAWASNGFLQLPNSELDWLATHLGHDISVHRNFYRLQESTLELAKVSKLLVAVDEGNASQMAGKKLDEIGLNGNNWYTLTTLSSLRSEQFLQVPYCYMSCMFFFLNNKEGLTQIVKFMIYSGIGCLILICIS